MALAPAKPSTPQVKDMHLTENELLMISKYFNDAESPPSKQVGVSEDTLLTPTMLAQDQEPGLRKDQSVQQPARILSPIYIDRSLGSRGSKRASPSHGEDSGTEGLLDWTKNLNMDSIDML
jgi:hypothetical protein